MAETLAEMLAYIAEVVPKSVNSTTIVSYINKEQNKYWDKLTSTSYNDFTLSSGVSYYNLPTDCKFEYIRTNGLSVYETTSAIASSDSFTKYRLAGADEEFEYNSYYRFSTQLGIHPTPTTSGKYVRLWYQVRPTVHESTSPSVEFNLDNDWIDFIRYKVISRVLKTGNNPDVELANNYEAEAENCKKTMLMRKAKERFKDSRKISSYKDGWC